MLDGGTEQDGAVVVLVVPYDGKAGEGLARVGHQVGGLDGLLRNSSVQGQVVDAVAVATMCFALLG